MSGYQHKTKRRWGFCANGHKLTDENTYKYVDKKNVLHRRCAECKADYERKRRANAHD